VSSRTGQVQNPAESRTAKGRVAEEIVAGRLLENGWDVVARNWRRGRGELDIVAHRGDSLVFVEVKVTDAYGIESLGSSVGYRKRLRIVETSKLFLSEHREFNHAAVRYDVASVRKGILMDYFENAFVERS